MSKFSVSVSLVFDIRAAITLVNVFYEEALDTIWVIGAPIGGQLAIIVVRGPEEESVKGFIVGANKGVGADLFVDNKVIPERLIEVFPIICYAVEVNEPV